MRKTKLKKKTVRKELLFDILEMTDIENCAAEAGMPAGMWARHIIIEATKKSNKKHHDTHKSV
jgi:hypothetical protein